MWCGGGADSRIAPGRRASIIRLSLPSRLWPTRPIKQAGPRPMTLGPAGSRTRTRLACLAGGPGERQISSPVVSSINFAKIGVESVLICGQCGDQCNPWKLKSPRRQNLDPNRSWSISDGPLFGSIQSLLHRPTIYEDRAIMTSFSKLNIWKLLNFLLSVPLLLAGLARILVASERE